MHNNKHTANFLASSFLKSKRSLKKIYNLDPFCISILRYVCDSIDINHKKSKKFETKISQMQIAKHCWMSKRKVKYSVRNLTKKRLLKYLDHKAGILTLGKILKILLAGAYCAPAKEREAKQTLRSSHNSSYRASQRPYIAKTTSNIENQSTSHRKDDRKVTKESALNGRKQIKNIIEKHNLKS